MFRLPSTRDFSCDFKYSLPFSVNNAQYPIPIYVAVTRNQNENSVISKCLVDGSERISGNIIN
jgi:hypothetical protein